MTFMDDFIAIEGTDDNQILPKLLCFEMLYQNNFVCFLLKASKILPIQLSVRKMVNRRNSSIASCFKKPSSCMSNTSAMLTLED